MRFEGFQIGHSIDMEVGRVAQGVGRGVGHAPDRGVDLRIASRR